MLDERSRTLLKTLVEHYIADGQPVGSRALSKFSGLDLSPATIRNVMADLEAYGFVASPHTSAGRIPTPKGYRFFIDTLLKGQPYFDEMGIAYVVQIPIGIALCIIGICTADQRYHLGLVVAHLVYQLLWIAGLFTMHT